MPVFNAENAAAFTSGMMDVSSDHHFSNHDDMEQPRRNPRKRQHAEEFLPKNYDNIKPRQSKRRRSPLRNLDLEKPNAGSISANAGGSLNVLARRQETVRKSSSIMSLLNDDYTDHNPTTFRLSHEQEAAATSDPRNPSVLPWITAWPESSTPDFVSLSQTSSIFDAPKVSSVPMTIPYARGPPPPLPPPRHLADILSDVHDGPEVEWQWSDLHVTSDWGRSMPSFQPDLGSSIFDRSAGKKSAMDEKFKNSRREQAVFTASSTDGPTYRSLMKGQNTPIPRMATTSSVRRSSTGATAGEETSSHKMGPSDLHHVNNWINRDIDQETQVPDDSSNSNLDIWGFGSEYAVDLEPMKVDPKLILVDSYTLGTLLSMNFDLVID
jgi:hypothetical protein